MLSDSTDRSWQRRMGRWRRPAGHPIRQDHHDVAVVARRRVDYVAIDEFDPPCFGISNATLLLRRQTRSR